ncbi:MAG: ABC transporter permease subunit [Planctomycetes bacterium]|nr:ABC transporter permease subunit [Planctomycetota bacterium]
MRTLSATWTIFLRELGGFFLSPVAYVVTFLFVFANGWVFYQNCVGWEHHPQQVALVVRSLFSFALFWVVPISPLLTMKLFAEEKRTGTLEMLMTAPVTETAVVLGKFLAAHVFYMLIWSTLLLYVFTLHVLGRPHGPDWGPVWAIYTGLFFLGLMTNSLGLLASSLSRNQLVAAVLALTGNLGFLIVALGSWISYESSDLQRFFEYLSFSSHFSQDYTRGIIDVRYLAYYAVWAALFLFLSIRFVEARKWR